MKFQILAIIIACSFALHGQSAYEIGLLPSININTKLKSDWALNFKLESRQSLLKGDFGDEASLDYQYLLSDMSMIVSKRITPSQTLGVGYLLRLRANGSVGHRSIQQYSIVRRYELFRLSHRLSSDQLFVEGHDTEFRFRYRLSSEIPLNGQTVDRGEFFVKLNNEYLMISKGDNSDLEIRVGPYLGYALSNATKLEVGLDYRINSFLSSNSSSQRFWLAINLFQSF